VPEENFWTLWCKGRLTEADTMTIRLGAIPSGLTSAHLHHRPIFFTGWMPFLPPNQQCQNAEGNHLSLKNLCHLSLEVLFWWRRAPRIIGKLKFTCQLAAELGKCMF